MMQQSQAAALTNVRTMMSPALPSAATGARNSAHGGGYMNGNFVHRFG
jgi:hypothetical protein